MCYGSYSYYGMSLMESYDHCSNNYGSVFELDGTAAQLQALKTIFLSGNGQTVVLP